MFRGILLVLALAALAGCGSSASGIDPAQEQKDAVRQQHDCADPAWKAAHLGVWYVVCRPNDALR
jgi:uncharacterized protein YceK